MFIKIDFGIENNAEENFFGIQFDTQLSSENFVRFLWKKSSQKLHALSRIIMKAFITSQLCYCPLICIFQSLQLNNQINRTQEKPPRLTHTNYPFGKRELFERGNSVTFMLRICKYYLKT